MMSQPLIPGNLQESVHCETFDCSRQGKGDDICSYVIMSAPSVHLTKSEAPKLLREKWRGTVSLVELYGVHAALLTNILVTIKTLKGYHIANNSLKKEIKFLARFDNASVLKVCNKGMPFIMIECIYDKRLSV